MHASMKLPDTSKELIIHRYGNGIKLVAPEKTPRSAMKRTVAQALGLSFNVYFLTTESRLVDVNEACAAMMGATSRTAICGRPTFDFLSNKCAQRLRENDIAVIKQCKLKVIEECLEVLNTDVNNNLLSIKVPWYNEDNKIIGIFGCAFLLQKKMLSQYLMQAAELGLLDAPKETSAEKKFSTLTQRETDTTQHLMRGLTAKGIARVLNISSRTAEKHIDNIKAKLGVRSKSELIQLLVDVD